MSLISTLAVQQIFSICIVVSFLVSVIVANTNIPSDNHDNRDLMASVSSNCHPRVTNSSDAALFATSSSIRVAAPTRFVPPLHWLGANATVLVRPILGAHRADADAVLAYAEGYPLEYYIMFLETLRRTGYAGDVVLAIAEERIVYANVMEYLRDFAEQYNNNNDKTSQPNLVVYQVALRCEGDDNTTFRRVMNSGQTDIFQFCQFPHGVYGVMTNDTVVPTDDPRPGRVVATLRYEWYWMWSQHYHPHSWLMLIDARDSFFQSNPFAHLPREQRTATTSTTTSTPDSGLLYLFGENTQATRLGKSTKNLKWLRNGYGDATLHALADKPTLCSGSTMGETIAVETYLRALVNEHDESDVRMTGSDQGFHNYLYYSQKLSQAQTIRKMIVWEQGRGIINNLGALRTQPLAAWGMYCPETHQVFNWDGSLSPVVHQWDRDKDLHTWMVRVQHKEWLQEWEEKRDGLKEMNKLSSQ